MMALETEGANEQWGRHLAVENIGGLRIVCCIADHEEADKEVPSKHWEGSELRREVAVHGY